MSPIRATDLFGTIYDAVGRRPRFVIFSSYGNDSVALIQWAADQGLEDVVVVFSDTGWAAKWWSARVDLLEFWVHSLGFWTDRTTSMGFKALAKKKKGFPTQQFQWCSYILKIEPGERWLDQNDPERRAVCLVGVRRDEGDDRADFPRYLARSGNHGYRVMLTPFADDTVEQRDAYLKRAGVKPLPHRSMECSPCVNSNKEDLKALTPDQIDEVEAFELEMDTEFGPTPKGNRRTLFRPHRHMGAVGIREVVKWSFSKRGKYAPPVDAPTYVKEPSDDLPSKDLLVCNNGFCAN